MPLGSRSKVPRPLEFSYDYFSLSPPQSPRSESHTTSGIDEQPSICERREDITNLWFQAVIPLLGHFIFITGVAGFVFFFIDNQLFNISLRAPPVTQFDGSAIHLASHPLQSDITTALSIALSFMRTTAAMWTAATAWRCIFILMEDPGISLQAINWMTMFSLPTKPETWQGVVVAVILVAAFPSQYSSPVLTGSITWEPALNLVQGSQPAVNISISSAGQPWTLYKQWSENIETVVLIAAGVADTAWRNSDDDQTTMKRVPRSSRNLLTNSTLNNVTVLYFTVDAFEWIKVPLSTLNEHEKTAFIWQPQSTVHVGKAHNGVNSGH